MRITLDAETFKALASATRLSVMRQLDERRKTLSELARDLELNKATLHEHLALLSAAGLVRKRDDEGRKWIYYELTWTGQKILHPQETTTFNLLLGAGVAAAGGGIAMLGRALGFWLQTHSAPSIAQEPVPAPPAVVGLQVPASPGANWSLTARDADVTMNFSQTSGPAGPQGQYDMATASSTAAPTSTAQPAPSTTAPMATSSAPASHASTAPAASSPPPATSSPAPSATQAASSSPPSGGGAGGASATQSAAPAPPATTTAAPMTTQTPQATSYAPPPATHTPEMTTTHAAPSAALTNVGNDAFVAGEHAGVAPAPAPGAAHGAGTQPLAEATHNHFADQGGWLAIALMLSALLFSVLAVMLKRRFRARPADPESASAAEALPDTPEPPAPTDEPRPDEPPEP